MTKKFAITGTPAPQRAPRTADQAHDIDHFVTGVEPQTTMTVQIPARLKRALKQQALDRDTSVKNLLIEILEAYFAQLK